MLCRGGGPWAGRAYGCCPAVARLQGGADDVASGFGIVRCEGLLGSFTWFTAAPGKCGWALIGWEPALTPGVLVGQDGAAKGWEVIAPTGSGTLVECFM